MTKILCTNEDCVAYDSEEQRFSVSVVVNEDCEVRDDIESIQDKYFTCCFCHEKTAMKFIPLEEPISD